MLAREVLHNTSAEVTSQIVSYFTIVNNSVQVGDINKRYTPTTSTCHGSPCPVQHGTYTNVLFSPTADNTAGIYNGYIYSEMKMERPEITKAISQTPAQTDFGSPFKVWVRFRDAMDAIEKYEILANGETIYT